MFSWNLCFAICFHSTLILVGVCEHRLVTLHIVLFVYSTYSFLFLFSGIDMIADSKQTQTHTVTVMFSFCHWLSVIVALPYRRAGCAALTCSSYFDSEGQAVFQTGLWCQRRSVLISEEERNEWGKQIKWELTGSSVGLKSHWGTCHFLST